MFSRLLQGQRHQFGPSIFKASRKQQMNKAADVTNQIAAISTNQNSRYITQLGRGFIFQHSPRVLTNQKSAFINHANGNVKPFQQSRETSTASVKIMTEEKSQTEKSQLPNFDLRFDDFRMAFKTKSRWELIRALSILWMCSFDFVANNATNIMLTSERLLGQRASRWLLRRLVYDQFVGGETREEILEVVGKLRNSHVGPLLAAPMEDDIDVFRQDADEKCDRNLEVILSGMAMARDLDPQYPMTQLKISALMPGNFCAFLSDRCPKPSATPEVIDALASALTGQPLDIDQVFGSGFPDGMKHHLERGIARVAKVCQMAVDQRVVVMVDAEYTSMNPALNLFSLAMMCVCNHSDINHPPLVFCTYQNYLKMTRDILHRDLQFADSRAIGFGAKLVRGAYMQHERRLAATCGHPDPVHDSIEDTSRAYDEAVTSLLHRIAAKPRQYRVIVASHNEKSILEAVRGIQQLGIDPSGGSVFFGQVKGMSDHISSSLGMNGFLARKSVPYGPVSDTLSYLSRRAQENRDLFHGRRDRTLITSELLHRFRLRAA